METPPNPVHGHNFVPLGKNTHGLHANFKIQLMEITSILGKFVITVHGDPAHGITLVQLVKLVKLVTLVNRMKLVKFS